MPNEVKWTKEEWWRSGSGGVCIGRRDMADDPRPNDIFCDVRANVSGITREDITSVERLIASAPLLYEALEAVQFKGHNQVCPTCKKNKHAGHGMRCDIGNALRAARGETGEVSDGE